MVSRDIVFQDVPQLFKISKMPGSRLKIQLVNGSWFMAQGSLAWAPGPLENQYAGIFVLLHISISCFLEDIDPIFKISKSYLDESSYFLGARLFPNSVFFGFQFSTCQISNISKVPNLNSTISKFQSFKI